MVKKGPIASGAKKRELSQLPNLPKTAQVDKSINRRIAGWISRNSCTLVQFDPNRVDCCVRRLVKAVLSMSSLFGAVVDWQILPRCGYFYHFGDTSCLYNFSILAFCSLTAFPFVLLFAYFCAPKACAIFTISGDPSGFAALPFPHFRALPVFIYRNFYRF